jgi:hypothetical protein
MMDNLQEAYTAYQQALYYLRDPKVSPARCPKAIAVNIGPRNRNFGMELVYYTTDMAHLSTPKRLSVR